MKYVLLVIYYSILSTLSINLEKPKICINCKFFKKHFLVSDKYGQCTLFPVIRVTNENYLVDGVKPFKDIDYEYCSILRKYDDRCGKDGKLFEKKN